MMWKGHESRMLVAGHRGERYTSPENTLTSFRRALALGVDMLETDIRMTADHELVIMHDATVDRTTDGTGRVQDMTLEQFKSLDAACGFDNFPAEAPPTFEEFLKLCEHEDNLLIDFELKDYPTPGNEEFAYESADRAIAMLEQYGFGDRCVLNSFSAKLLEYIDEKYSHRYRLHGYYPYFILQDKRRAPKDYLYCACLFPQTQLPDGSIRTHNFNVSPKAYFDAVRAEGLIPWVGAGVRGREEILRCAELGAPLITTDYPADALTILREAGLHD